ncbi:YheC/YheD family endospore coat-associated protein [Alicyclobacillus dauci]|uniref:YheC/YheD family protein n=1 Tax=Alicyclobacillus dauci TaxID=1475485 RepID=A0ABY6Z6H3_9BACL|nr:YheC/YheD family protein [Alicyclobacillus dauci]WAH38487.1 YheC/YheD family protein [Alicyclobacillus dauci]
METPSTYIGVATTVVPKLKQTKQGKWKRPAMQYVRLAEVARKRYNAMVYLFHPHRVDWSRGRVEAWLPESLDHPRQNWVKRTVPLPDVIYENVFVHLAIKGYTASLRQEAQKRRIPLFNPVLPGKWRMVELLKQSGMMSYSPETERLRSPSQLRRRLGQWGIAFVKPVGGYGGMDVNRVERLGDGRYRVGVDRTSAKTARMRVTMGDAELAKWSEGKIRRPHLLQRGLRLMTVGNRKVDFRVVVHRDVRGDWQLVGIVPKMAAADGVVTNIIAGGQRIDLEALVAAARTENKEIPVALLDQKSKDIAKQLSNRYPTVGLVGFDMAVEENGKVSMIEMNPKPARSLLSVPMLEQLAIHTVGFAVFLARKRRKAGAVLAGFETSQSIPLLDHDA